MSADRTPAGGTPVAQSADTGATASDHARGAGKEGPAAVLETRVLRPLLVAMQDYTTNDRGDVGSWVRTLLTVQCQCWPSFIHY